MPHTNPFFSSTTGYSGEVNLLDDLVREQIQMYGVDLQYMPRKMINLDSLLHEATKSVFEVAMPIPAYIKTFDGYDNGMELLTKFGVRNSDELTLQISGSMFETYFTPYMDAYYTAQNGGEAPDRLKGQTAHRPKEGDLIYFPFDDGIFEIKYVNFDQPFFQLGKGYIFELQCEKFEYSGETFETGIEDIDDTVEDTGYYQLDFTLAPGGFSTFEKFEMVTIYNLENIDNPDLSVPDPIDPFRLQFEPGFYHDVPTVHAKVVSWDITTRTLTLSDISNNDPDGENETTYDITENDLSNVLIVGDTTDASWMSASVTGKEVPFNDAKDIQTEFDEIKIVDPTDKNPFGFF